MTEPSSNENIEINLNAISTICYYPLKTLRKDMSSQEWTEYKDSWYTFNRIWAYNYSVSTINGTQDQKKRPWQFVSNKERVNYVKGQTAHVENYPVQGQFNNIPN